MPETIAPLDFGVTVNAPCAGIAFSRLKDWDLKVVMYFSHVIDGIAEDLEISFERAFALTWHEEALHSVSISWPKPLPTFRGGKWDRWTYPFLQIYQVGLDKALRLHATAERAWPYRTRLNE
jgi:hypothetical protein